MEEFAKFEPSLERVFHKIDLDKNGYIEPVELSKAFEMVGKAKTDEEIAAAVAKLDLNNDGKVSLDEFKKLTRMMAEA